MGVRVEPDDLPDHLVLQHRHNLNRSAEADAQHAGVAVNARMMAEPVRQVGLFGGPLGASAAEGVAQTVEQAGGARSGYDPLAIAGQAALPVLAGKVAQAAGRYQRSRAALGTKPLEIAPVPQPKIGEPVKGSYFGPERRASTLTPAQAAEEQAARRAGRFIERRKTVGEGGDPSLSDFHRYNLGQPQTADFLDTFDRTRRR